MIKFFDKDGNIFEGASPYVHWVEGGQSVGLWYSLKLFVISDNASGITCSGLGDNSVFKFIDKNKLPQEGEIDSDIKISNLIYDSYTDTSEIPIESQPYYVYQILLVCNSQVAGQFIDSFDIENNGDHYSIQVGCDFYEENETLNINLSNNGLDIPNSIYKAFYETDYREACVDNILINQKFKELVSNFIDVVDCKGSYKSLINSLKWFDWGENTKLYEIWKTDDKLFEKDLELILSDVYSYFLYTHSKSTHLSLVTLLYKITNGIDNEKNPVLEPIERQWTNEELSIKTSILGAFFERYFMPIHLDLKRASIEACIYTNSVKLSNGTMSRPYNFFDDTGVMDIEINNGQGNVVVLGNLTGSEGNYRPVAVGPKTMFGIQYDKKSNYDEKYIVPIGVDFLDNISMSNDDSEESYQTHSDDLATFYSQLIGGVGVVVPVKVSVKLPDGDGIHVETINLYKNNKCIPYTERRLFKPELGKVEINFNLLSTTEEEVTFSIILHSLSGHTWMKTASYKAVDISGSFINICKVVPRPLEDLQDNFIDNMNGNPWGTQYNTIKVEPYTNVDSHIEPDKYKAQQIVYYLPINSYNSNQYYRQYVRIENPKVDGENYKNLINDYNGDDYWCFGIGPEDSQEVHKYSVFIAKDPVTEISEDLQNIINDNHVEKQTYTSKIHIPQLYDHENIDLTEKIDDCSFNNDDLLCIVPQFSKSIMSNINLNSVCWEFKNMTTLTTIKTNIPQSIPYIASSEKQLLDSGYWTVTMRFKFVSSGEEHVITKNSAFIIK